MKSNEVSVLYVFTNKVKYKHLETCKIKCKTFYFDQKYLSTIFFFWFTKNVLTIFKDK